MPPAELAGLVPLFSDEIARSKQFFQLLNNCLNSSQWAPAIAIARRIVAADPARDDVAHAARACAKQTRRAALGSAATTRARAAAASATSSAMARWAPPPRHPAHRLLLLPRTRWLRGQCRRISGATSQAPSATIARRSPSTPDHPAALHYLGVIHYQRNRLGDALPLLERAVALVPEEPEFHNNLGLALAAADRTDEAIAQFRQALALKPDLATAWNNLGLSLQAANELPDAIAAFRRSTARRAGFRAGALEPGAGAAGQRPVRGRLARIRVAASRANLRCGGNVVGAALAGRGAGRPHPPPFRRTGSRRRAAIRALRGAACCARRTRDRPGTRRAATNSGQCAGRRADIARRRRAAARTTFSCHCFPIAGMLDIDERAIPATVPYLAPSRAPRRGAGSCDRRCPGNIARGPFLGRHTRHVNDRRRSCPLAALAPLLELPDIAWFSLQKDRWRGPDCAGAGGRSASSCSTRETTLRRRPR